MGATNFLHFRLDSGELVIQHGFEQSYLAWEMGIERFLAYAEVSRQIVHDYAAEAMAEEMSPGGFDDSVPGSRGGLTGGAGRVGEFVVWHNTMETIVVYLVSYATKMFK
jgi:hypothetical protein